MMSGGVGVGGASDGGAGEPLSEEPPSVILKPWGFTGSGAAATGGGGGGGGRAYKYGDGAGAATAAGGGGGGADVGALILKERPEGVDGTGVTGADVVAAARKNGFGSW